MGGEEVSYTRHKVVLIIYMSLYSSSLMGLNLVIPEILTSIVHHMHPSYTVNQQEGLASTYKSFIDGINAVVGLIALPIFGGISDVIGRKKIMIVGILAYATYVSVMILGFHFKSLYLVYLASISSFSMVNQICTLSYMSDVAKDEKDKAMSFGFVLAAFMFGYIVGSFVLGYAVKVVGVASGLYIVLGITGAAFLFLVIAFREDSPYYRTRHERKFSFAKSNPFTSLRLILGMNSYVSVLAIVYAINFFGVSDSSTSGFLYTQNRYGWGSYQNGVVAAVGGASSVVWQVVGMGILLKFFTKERVLTLSFLFTVVIHFAQGYAPKAWIYLTASAIGGFSAIGFPVIQALVSQKIPKEKQGIAFGGLSSISSIAIFLGALFSENIFSWCLANDNKYATCPGTAYYICGFMFFVGGVICAILFWKYPPSKESVEITEIIIEEEESLLASGEYSAN